MENKGVAGGVVVLQVTLALLQQQCLHAVLRDCRRWPFTRTAGDMDENRAELVHRIVSTQAARLVVRESMTQKQDEPHLLFQLLTSFFSPLKRAASHDHCRPHPG